MDSAAYVFPAVRGTQAQREYYISMVPLDVMSKIFQFADEDLPPEIRAQRILNKSRIPEIRDYILSNPDSYVFSALTVSVDGNMEFMPADEMMPQVGAISISMTSSPDTLRHMLGINGLKLWMYANGTDTSRVMHKDFVSPVKSIGHGITCTADLQTPEDVFRVMLELSQDVGHRLRVHELMACGVQVSIRTNDLYGSQYQCKLPFRTQLPNEIAGAGFHLLMERYRWDKPIRAVTIRGIDLVSQKDAEQLSMFVDHQKRDRRILLEDAVEDIRRRFGKRAISYAILMGDLKIPDDDRQLVTMPGLMYQ